MTVEELIAKLKKCPKKAVVCWDSNKLNYWFGEEIEVLPWTKSRLREETFCDDGNYDDLPNFRNIVRLS
jgi:hypothetical protein